MEPVPKKVRVEMLEREVIGLDIELRNAYLEVFAVLRRIEVLLELYREVATRLYTERIN
jgi:hypothetical protein